MSNYPKEIILEVTNRCNLRCVMCHFHGIGARRVRPSGDMAPELWRKVLQEIAQSPETHSLITHGAGEPLLYPALFDLLKEAKYLKNVTVGFMTNAMLLTPEVTCRLLELGVDWLAFSVDGVEPEPHARYRRNSNLETIERHIDYLIESKNARGTPRPALCFNMVCLPEIAHQESSYVARWLPSAAHVMISNYRPMGSRHLATGNVPEARQPCPNIFRQMVVGWNGTVALCCEDIHAEVELGDLKRQSISEVWNGPRLNKIREIHHRNAYDEMPFCRDCDTWAASHILSSKEDPKDFEKIVTPSYAMYRRKNDNAQE